MTHPLIETKEPVLWLESVNIPSLSFAVNMEGRRISTAWITEKDGYTDLAADRQAASDREAGLYFTQGGVLDLKLWLDLRQEREAACKAALKRQAQIYKKRKDEIGPHYKGLNFTLSDSCVYTCVNDKQVKVDGSDFVVLIPSANNIGVSCKDIYKAYEAWESGGGIAGPMSSPVKKSDGGPCPIPEIEAAYKYHKASDAFESENNVAAIDLECERAYNRAYKATVALCLAPAKSFADLYHKLNPLSDFVIEAFEDGETGYEAYALRGIKRDMRALMNKNGERIAAMEGAA